MVPRDYVHGYAISTETLKKHFAVAVQCLEVNVPTVLIVVTEVYYVLDTMFIQIWEEHFVVEAFLVIDEYVGRITNTTVGIVQ